MNVQDVLCQLDKSINGVNDDMQEAEVAINKWLESNKIEFSIILSTIINSDSDQITNSHIILAVMLLQKIFSFSSLKELRSFRNFWIDTWKDDQRENIRLAVIRTLLFEQENIIANGSKLCATLYSFDLSELHICERLATIMDPDQYTTTAARAALICTAEICTNEWFDKVAKENFIQESGPLLEIIGAMYQSITDIDINLGEELLKTLRILVMSCPELFINPKMLESIYSYARAVLPICESSTLCELFFVLLENIIENLYPLEDFLEVFNWNTVIEMIIESFGFYEDPELKVNPIMFILQLAKFEGNNLKRGRKVSNLLSKMEEFNRHDSAGFSLPKVPPFHNLIGQHAETLVQMLIEIPKNIPSEDTEFEETPAVGFTRIAFEAIEALHVVAPDVVLSFCQSFIEENSSERQWQISYIISMIPSLLSSEIHRSLTYTYITQEMPLILLSFIEIDSGNMRLLGSAYQSISTIINAYEINLDDETIERILENGHRYIQAAPSIAQVICTTFISIMEHKIDKKSVWDFREKIFNVFDCLNDTFSDDVPTVTRGFKMLCFWIKNSPEDVYEELSQIVIERVKDDLTTAVQTIDTNPMAPTILMDTLWLVHYLFNRYRMKSIPESEELAVFLLNVMKADGIEPYHEDILGPLIDILRCLNLESPEIPEEIVSYIPFAMDSRSPTLVCTVIKSIAVLFDCNPDMMQELCPSIIDDIGDLIADDTFPTSEKIRLLESLGVIIKATHENFDANLRDEIFVSITDIFDETVAKDPSVIDDEICISELVVGIYSVIVGLMLATEPGDPGFFRSVNFKKLVGPIKVFANTGLLNNDALNTLLDFFETAVSRFGSRGSLYLNAPQNYCILAWCCLSRRSSLRRRAAELRIMMKDS